MHNICFLFRLGTVSKFNIVFVFIKIQWCYWILSRQSEITNTVYGCLMLQMNLKNKKKL